MKNRLKSIPLWSAVLALIYLLCDSFFGIQIPNWADISAKIISILTIVFGVVNNPTDHEKF